MTPQAGFPLDLSVDLRGESVLGPQPDHFEMAKGPRWGTCCDNG